MGGGVAVGLGTTFAMHGGTVSGNSASENGEGIFVGRRNLTLTPPTIVRIGNGTIHGNMEGIRTNTAGGGGAALYNRDAVNIEYGIWNLAGMFIPNGAFVNIALDSTVRIASGILQP